MPLFKYTARDINPQSRTHKQDVSGHLNAKSEARATNRLLKRLLVVHTIVEIDAGFSKLDKLKGVSLDDCIMLSRQLCIMLETGIDLAESIATCSKISKSPLLRHELRKCHQHVREGHTCSSFFIGNKIFPRIIGTLLEVGETTGNMHQAAEMLAKHFEFQQDNSRKVSEALNKPKQLLTMIGVIMTLMLIFVIPKLLATFTGPVPLPTRIVMTASWLITDRWYIILAVLFNVYITIRFWLSKGGDIIWDKHKKHIPVIGQIWMRYEMIIFTRTCSMMYKAGIPFADTLITAAETAGNKYLTQRIEIMKDCIEGGMSITHSAMRAHVFPIIVETMLTVGEKTGAIDRTLDNAATFYKREIDYDLKMLDSKIQPYILYFCGGLVLLIVLSIYMPMLESLVSNIRR